MTAPNLFKLPDVGEGLLEAEIVSWKVKEGDTVAVNDVIVEIETAKSLVELPSPYAGVVAALMVAEGETVDVGTPIIAIGSGSVQGSAAEPAAPATAAPQAPAPEEAEVLKPLVGSGPKADAVKRRPRLAAASAVPAQAAAPAAAPAPAAAKAPGQDPASGIIGKAAATANRMVARANRVLAKPPVRKAAKDLGINLSEVLATGLRGEVTKKDLLSYHDQRAAEQAAAGSFWAPAAAQGSAEDPRIERIKVKGVRKATAKAMVDSAFTAPHVSIFVDVDASRTMEFVKRLKVSRDFEGIKVSPLLILAKAVIWAAARNPSVNATWTGDEILIKHFMNLGIAAATPRGLMVPNIKDAQDLSLKELAVALNELATTARAGKTAPAAMQGGTLTVTNIGALGIDTGTPIINPGEVAIVAFGTIKQKPWVVDGEVVPRWVTTLGGSFDHRVVDGDLSARFMADVAAIMEEPALLLD
ncbi:pyruvate dehydrogenase E2 component (dihydrolipoamide acetyltransferase) [Arthrobacter stackebrandtii]|uniref:Dihydrolipoamide acetyltransferase component of pyruvate dehydrogenase complex n=1 Tax=Arthrobacter stackebrandtii TaxID=272161 RepID=A0ABS4YUW9_9MICC|nr:dihydrolipoamide acetyltransferase family protein [Arthrobacter stackebrandtii]MBP2412597.1 pyruvate dehydrogenase E2 component (dihydrolipoamide acetyltransferase) [Arthrobacter stackebrandtii]PYH02336.1 branched-chain alpha-keto acid dehydrogenase subunit E2 [Arthrobacter stackebrandtii]